MAKLRTPTKTKLNGLLATRPADFDNEKSSSCRYFLSYSIDHLIEASQFEEAQQQVLDPMFCGRSFACDRRYDRFIRYWKRLGLIDQIEDHYHSRVLMIKARAQNLDLAKIIGNFGDLLTQSSLFNLGLEVAKLELSIFEKFLDKSDPQRMNAERGLVLNRAELGDWDGAIEILDDLAMRWDVSGQSHSEDAIKVLTLKADCLSQTGSAPEAYASWALAVQKCEACLGKSHRLTLLALNRLGLCCVNQMGQLSEGLMHLKECAARAKDSGYVIESLIYQFNILRTESQHLTEINGNRIGTHIEAMESVISELYAVCGDDHVNYIMSKLAVAGALTFAESYDTANEIFGIFIPRLQKKIGSEHPVALTHYLNYAESLYRTDQNVEAREVCLTALRQNDLEINDRNSIGFLKLARIDDELNFFDEAQAAYLKFLSYAEREPLINQYDLASYTQEVGDFFYGYGHYHSSNEYFRQALELWPRELGPGAYEVICAKRGIAKACIELGHYQNSVILFREIIEYLDSADNQDDLLDAQYLLGKCLSRVGSYAESVEILTDVLRLEDLACYSDENKAYTKFELAFSLLGQNQYQTAIDLITDMFDHDIDLNQNNGGLLATLLFDLGNEMELLDEVVRVKLQACIDEA